MTHGFILGNFAPFHRGHAFLIQEACKKCDRLAVLVCSKPSDEIPGWLRYHWVKSTFPELDVRHMIGSSVLQLPESLIPKKSGSESSIVWFESGEKQKSLALSLGFHHVSIDPERHNFPTQLQKSGKIHLLIGNYCPLLCAHTTFSGLHLLAQKVVVKVIWRKNSPSIFKPFLWKNMAARIAKNMAWTLRNWILPM